MYMTNFELATFNALTLLGQENLTSLLSILMVYWLTQPELTTFNNHYLNKLMLIIQLAKRNLNSPTSLLIFSKSYY